MSHLLFSPELILAALTDLEPRNMPDSRRTVACKCACGAKSGCGLQKDAGSQVRRHGCPSAGSVPPVSAQRQAEHPVDLEKLSDLVADKIADKVTEMVSEKIMGEVASLVEGAVVGTADVVLDYIDTRCDSIEKEVDSLDDLFVPDLNDEESLPDECKDGHSDLRKAVNISTRKATKEDSEQYGAPVLVSKGMTVNANLPEEIVLTDDVSLVATLHLKAKDAKKKYYVRIVPHKNISAKPVLLVYDGSLIELSAEDACVIPIYAISTDAEEVVGIKNGEPICKLKVFTEV